MSKKVIDILFFFPLISICLVSSLYGSPFVEKVIEKSVPQSGHTLQVAGFFQENKAKRLTIRLLEKGYDAYWVVAYPVSSGKILYRVHTGYFKEGDIYKAKKQATVFAKKEGIKPYVCLLCKRIIVKMLMTLLIFDKNRCIK